MFRFIKFIFTGDWHLHKWKKYRTEVTKDGPGGNITGYDHIRECSICGELKNFKT